MSLCSSTAWSTTGSFGKAKWSRIKLITLLFLSIYSGHCQDTKGMCNSTTTDEIDDLIETLNYYNDEILAYDGASKSSAVKYEGKLDNKKNFIVITRTKRNLQNKKPDIGVVVTNEHQSYPGALLLANQKLVDNSPEELAVDRAPITYTVNLPGLTSDDGDFTIVPSFNEFQSSTNKVLQVWFEKYHKDREVVANFQTDQCFAFSEELLRVKFGVAFKNSIIETAIDFDSVKNQEKLIIVYKFKQIFYTVSVQPTKKPSDLFDCEVSVADLQKKINNKNPPVIVDSVSYGRTVYVVLETSSTDKETKAMLKNDLTKFFINKKNEIEYKKKLKNLSMQVYVIGGSSDNIALLNARTLEEVNDVIVRYGKFSRNNLGYPLSYTAQFIKDNTRAVVNLVTDYVETTRTIHKKGVIGVIHHGLFVTEWYITWNEISFDSKGDKVESKKTWERNGEHLTAPFEEEIELAGNSRNIHVLCRYVTGVPWQWWRTIIDSSGVELVAKREFKVSGTTLTPKYSISPEPGKEDES